MNILACCLLAAVFAVVGLKHFFGIVVGSYAVFVLAVLGIAVGLVINSRNLSTTKKIFSSWNEPRVRASERTEDQLKE